MNVAGGIGGDGGDLPIYISDLRPDSVVGRCSQIQVRVNTAGTPSQGFPSKLEKKGHCCV